jgi:hypothetical protein
MNHSVAIGADNGEIGQFCLPWPLSGACKWGQVMDVSIPVPELTTSSREIEPTLGHFTNEPTASRTEYLLDLRLAQLRFAIAMDYKSLILVSFSSFHAGIGLIEGTRSLRSSFYDCRQIRLQAFERSKESGIRSPAFSLAHRRKPCPSGQSTDKFGRLSTGMRSASRVCA